MTSIRTFLAAGLLVLLALVALRLAWPLAGRYPQAFEQALSGYTGQPVSIGQVQATWAGLRPRLVLSDLRLLDRSGERTPLKLPQAYLELDIWRSVMSLRLQPSLLILVSPQVTLTRHPDGSIALAGMERDAHPGASAATAAGWLMSQERLGVEAGHLVWCDEKAYPQSHSQTHSHTYSQSYSNRQAGTAGPCVAIYDVFLRLDNDGARHRVQGLARLPKRIGSRIELGIEIQGNPFAGPSWTGSFYAKGERLELAEGSLGDVVGGLLNSASVSGSCDAVLRGEINQAGLQHVRAEVLARGVRLQSAIASVALSQLSGTMVWERRAQGWRLSAERLILARERSQWPATSITLDAEGRRLHVNAGFLRLQDLGALALASGALGSDLNRALEHLQPSGDIYQLDASYTPGNPPDFTLDARFSELALIRNDGGGWPETSGPNRLSRVPGIVGLSGHIGIGPQGGKLTLDTRAATLDFTPLFRQTIGVSLAQGKLTWQRTEGGWSIESDSLELGTQDLRGRLWGSVHIYDDGSSPDVNLRLALGSGLITGVPRYLPAAVMHPASVRWLDDAFVAGRISGGEAVLQGRMNRFPFDDGSGRFEVDLHASETTLRYHSQWPLIDAIEADVRFKGRNMEILSRSGKVLDADIVQARVTIPDLAAKPAMLYVQGRAEGPMTDALQFVMRSPLQKEIGKYLQGMAASGNFGLSLNLTLPLSPDPNKVDGILELADNTLFIKSLALKSLGPKSLDRAPGLEPEAESALELAHVTGRLKFTERGLKTDALHGSLWGEKAQVSIHTEGGTGKKETIIEARSTTSAASLRRYLPLPVTERLQGKAGWQGTLRLPHTPGAAIPAALHLESELTGMRVDLPEPLGKTAAETRPFSCDVNLEGETRQLFFRYGDRLSGALAFRPNFGPSFDPSNASNENASNENEGALIERGHLHLGAEPANLPSRPGIRLTGSVPAINLDQWLDEWQALLGPGEQRSLLAELVHQIDLHAGKLDGFGQTLHAVYLKADRSADGWTADLTSEEVAGTGKLRLPAMSGQSKDQAKDQTGALLSLALQRLRLAPQSGKGAGRGAKHTLDPRDLPALQVRSDRFSYGATDLGRLSLHGSRHPQGLHLDRLELAGSAMQAHAQGDWLIDREGQRSSSTITVNAPELGKLLELFGYNGNVRGASTEMQIRAGWSGAPADFSLAGISGDLKLKMGKGRLLALEPGVGRVFGLLSLQALPRRLSWDFSDLFKKGFSFDRIQGQFKIRDGDARTDNLVMEGPAARVEIAGAVNLGAETYDQKVTVTPHVSTGLPLAGAIAGGPGVGAAVLLVQKLFQSQIEKMTSYQYAVTGSWENPVMTAIRRRSPESIQ